MTPEERHALADALDRDADHLDSRVGWQKYQSDADAYRARAARARQAAAALREMPSTEEVVTAARASLWEQMESEAVERLTAKVADLNAEITQLGSDIEDAYAERAAFSAELARLREVLPTVNEIERVRAIVRGDGPIDRMLARFEVARILLDEGGGS